MSARKFFIGLILFFSACLKLSADSLTFIPLLKIQESWLRYDQNYNNYVPYLYGTDEKQSTLYAWVDLTEYSDCHFVFTAEPGLSLFINDQLLYHNSSDEIQTPEVSVKEIMAFQQTSATTKLAIYQEEQKLHENTFQLGRKATISAETFSSDIIKEFTRKLNSEHVMMLGSFLLVLMLVAVLKNYYPKLFYDLFQFKTPLRQANPDDTGSYPTLSVPMFIAVFINAWAMSMVLNLTLGHDDYLISRGMGWLSGNGWWMILLPAFLVVALFLIKFIFITLLGWIFRFRSNSKLHFFEILKSVTKFNIIVLPLIMISYFNHWTTLLIDCRLYFILLFLLAGVVMFRLVFVLANGKTFRNIYLFSYICAAEFLPLIVAGKILL